MRYLLVVFLVFGWLTGAGAQEHPAQQVVDREKTFVWADDENFPPYIYRDNDGEIKGLFKDLMVELFSRVGVSLEYNVYAWKRTQLLVEGGAADGLVTVMTPRRSKVFFEAIPLLEVDEIIFTRKDHPDIEQLKAISRVEELKGFKIVEIVGSGWSEERLKGMDVVWVPQNNNAYLMLANRRADVYISNKYLGFWTIQHLIREYPLFSDNLKKLISCDHSLEKIHYSLLINKKSKWTSLIPELEKALKTMKSDGTYDRILKRYVEMGSKKMPQ